MDNEEMAVTPESDRHLSLSELLESCGLDPDTNEISGEVYFNKWQAHDGTWRYQYKFKFVPKPVVIDDEDHRALLRKISRHKYSKPEARTPHTRFVCLADWQAGKGQGGGTPALAERLAALSDAVEGLLREEKPERLYVVGMGDMVEGCQGHYSMQTFEVDMDRRQQVRFVRRYLTELLQRWSRYAPEVVVTCVPGNHGENRLAGRAFTSFGDNDDVAVFEQVAEIFSFNDAYGHLRFIIPEQDMEVVVNVDEHILAFVHGHQFGGGTTISAKAINWWKGQMAGRLPVGDADILVSGHYHHFQQVNQSGRTWMQCPALDGGSKWFTDKTGQHDPPGTLTFTIGQSGLDNVRLI